MSGTVLIISTYRSLNGCAAENENLMELFREINNEQVGHKVILGDFNMPRIDWLQHTTTRRRNSLEYRFIETVRDCFLTQHSKEVTRYRNGAKGSIMDLGNDEDIGEEIEIESEIGRSDPVCITFTCGVGTKERSSTAKIYMYERADFNDGLRNNS